RPASLVFSPSPRDRKWLELYDAHKGKMDEAFGKLAFTTHILTAFSSLDAKFTTSDMAKRLESWALFRPPRGKTWEPPFDERKKYPEVRPRASNPWTIRHAQAPPKDDSKAVAVDLHDLKGSQTFDGPPHEDEPNLHLTTAWHGTLLPKSDGDVWL